MRESSPKSLTRSDAKVRAVSNFANRETNQIGGQMRSYLDLPIRRKLQAIVMATSAAALLVASVVFAVFDRSTFLQAKTQDLSAAAKMVGSNSTAALAFGDARSAMEILSALRAKQHVANACIYDKNGKVFASYSRDAVHVEFSRLLLQAQSTAIAGSKMVLFQPITLGDKEIGTIYMEADLLDLDARLMRFLEIDSFVLLASLAVAFLLATRLQRVVSGPIQELADTALSVSTRENFSIRATKRGNDEIGLLFDQFNSMLDRIQQRDTELREAHDELETRVAERTSYLNALIENNPLAILVLDPERKIQLCNPSFEILFQCNQKDAMGKPVVELFPKEKALPETSIVFEAASNRASIALTTRRARKDGSYVDVELHLVPLTVSGRVLGSLGIYQDVTQRGVLERQLRMAQKMEAVGRLSGGISHDFNNLLGVIIGYIQVIKRSLVSGNSLYEYAEEIEKASQRAVALTRQLLAFSRQQVLEPVVLNLNTLVADMQKMLPRLIGEDIDLNLVFEPTLGQVKADPGQLEQVVMNLAVNARDAMPDGGKLTIRTANAEIDLAFAMEHAGSKPGKYVKLVVSDTGIGMDPETQAQIFEPFYTTKGRDKGTGLGLATVYGVVKQSNGYITVDSEKGKGSVFAVYLPLIEQHVVAPAESNPEPLDVHGSETILLVEDAEPLRKLAELFLKENGYRVVAAADGSEAQEVAAQIAGPIDLLLTDVVMPGINGRVLAERLAPAHPAMKVLYMSGYTDSFIAGHGVLEAGTHLLRKPFTEEVLVRKVRDLLDGRSDGEETEGIKGGESPVAAGPDGKLSAE
jgi:PAS domain S-box-containing protein